MRRAWGLATLLLALTAAPARAQVLIGILFGEKLATPTFNMGFEIGLNFATLDGLPGASRMNRTVFGLFGDWRFSEHFHLGGAILPAAGRGAERTTKRLPSCSISVSVSESRSAMISGQEPERPSAAIRSSSAFFSTSARKLQNT